MGHREGFDLDTGGWVIAGDRLLNEAGRGDCGDGAGS